jgi:hypothetical protein
LWISWHHVKASYLANAEWDMSWWIWVGLMGGLPCTNKKSLIVVWLW